MVKITRNEKADNEFKVEMKITEGKLMALLKALSEYSQHSVVGNDLYHEVVNACWKPLKLAD